jgi:hypothetical protein
MFYEKPDPNIDKIINKMLDNLVGAIVREALQTDNKEIQKKAKLENETLIEAEKNIEARFFKTKNSPL